MVAKSFPSRFFVHLLILLISLVLPNLALAAEYEYDGYKFTISGSTCTITGYMGTDNELVIPSTLRYDSQNYQVVEIGYGAFRNNSLLTSVTTPYTLKTISAYAFEYCTSLSTLNLNDGLVTIEYGALNETAITSLSLPDTVTELDVDFDTNGYVDNSYPETDLDVTLTYLKWTAGIPVIPHNQFENYSALETVVLPEGVSTIEDCCFVDCPALVSVTLPDTLQTIDYHAFANCDLRSLSLPKNLAYIGKEAFWYNENLLSVTIPASVKIIDDFAFLTCSSLSSITLNEGLETIGSSAFVGCPVVNLFIPDSVTTMPSSLISDDNTTLKTVRWSAGVPVIPDHIFEGASALEQVIIPDGITEIGFQSFYGCKSLKSISLPATLTTIGYRAFGSSGLEELYLPDSVTELTYDALGHLFALKTLRWTAGISVVETPFDSDDLVTLIVPEGVTSIGSIYTRSLTSVSLPSTLISIEDDAFRYCPISRVYLPKDISTISNESFNTTTTIVSMPDSATSALLDEKRIEYVFPTMLTLPADITKIEVQAFYGSNAEMVVVPEGCTLIGNEAFANMPLLHYVVVPAEATVANDAFDGSPVLHVVEQ